METLFLYHILTDICNVGLGQYGINLKDGVGQKITYPELYPRMKFVVKNHI